MSTTATTPDVDLAALEAIGAQIVDSARGDEQVEAYVARGGETEVRIYEGNVEHFVSAESAGVGVRIIHGGRTGFAYAGTLDPTAIDEVVAEARDNVAFGTVDEWAGLAEPDGVAVVEQQLWSDELAATATDDKIAMAIELEQAALALDPRIRIDDANYADSWSAHAVVTSTGIRRSGRGNGCYVVASTLATENDETQTGYGFSVGRSPSEPRSRTGSTNSSARRRSSPCR